MIIANPVRQTILVQIEAITAHAIHSGYADNLKDNLIVRDANGLPALPGSSIAGVLNHLYQERYGQEKAEALFGFANKTDSQISHLAVDWALLHNSDNEPVEGLHGRIENDGVLAWLAEDYPLSRDRVRLNERGASLENAKFDVSLLPKGLRYSFLLHIHSLDVEQAEHYSAQIVELLSSTEFRLGHGTRNGYGAFKVLQVNGKKWDLRKVEDAQEYRQFSRTRLLARKLPILTTEQAQNKHCVTLTLQLQAENGWRIGGGKHSLTSTTSSNQQQAQIMQQSEQFVQWHNNKANISERFIILPASAIKGAIAHRVAFHARRRAKVFATQGSSFDHLSCPEVKALFGYVDENDDSAAGKVVINDLMLDTMNQQIQQLMHNKIDHFTGGVINGALFSEEMLWQTSWPLTITLLKSSSLGKEQLQPLIDTLVDLSRGWLGIGAGTSRGQGTMNCQQWICSDKHWLEETGLILPDFIHVEKAVNHA